MENWPILVVNEAAGPLSMELHVACKTRHDVSQEKGTKSAYRCPGIGLGNIDGFIKAKFRADRTKPAMNPGEAHGKLRAILDCNECPYDYESMAAAGDKLQKAEVGVVTGAPIEKIENTFMYHAPKEGQQEKYEALRAKGKELAYLINDLCPGSREQSLAMTKLEEAIMWANASIARNE